MSFLRIKRKSEEDPKDAFILAGKKTKLEDVTRDSTVFELTSTAVQEKEINNLINETLAHRPDLRSRAFDLEKVRDKIRAENQQHAKRSKLKILNHIRKIDETVKHESETVKHESVPVIDVTSDTEKDENHNEYVYDLYYSDKCIDVTDPEFEKNYCIREVDDLFCINSSMEDDEEQNEDEDDSNDENNWRNEYPDEETDDSDAYLSYKMRETHLNSDYSLSSDGYDENDY